MQVEEPVLRIMERTTDLGAVVLTIQGEIDMATVDVLRARLTDACDRDAELRRARRAAPRLHRLRGREAAPPDACLPSVTLRTRL